MHVSLPTIVPALFILFGIDLSTSAAPSYGSVRFVAGIVLIVVGIIASITS